MSYRTPIKRTKSLSQIVSAATKYAKQSAARRAVVAGRRLMFPVRAGYQRQSGFYGRFTGKNAENKFFDTAISFTVDATGEVPATGQLNLIPQGVTESTRVGRKCVVKSIHIRGTMGFAPAGGTNANDLVYVYVVLDKQCNGAAAAITDVLTSNVISNAMINLANSERFTILKRIVASLPSGAGVSAAYSGLVKAFEFYHKCNLPIEFSSTTGAITEIRSNNLFLLAGTGSGDDLTTVTATCRLRFSDS